MSILDDIVEQSERRIEHKKKISKDRRNQPERKYPKYKEIKDRIKKLKAKEDEALKKVLDIKPKKGTSNESKQCN